MGSHSITITTLGEGPHWELEVDGNTVSLAGNSVDLGEIQQDQPSHFDFMCSITGRYQATVILPPADYLPTFDEEEEHEPVRLPIDLSRVEIRRYPWFDCEDSV